MSSPGPVRLTDNDPPKILLVDDEATGRRLLRRWIERGFDGKVVEAGNGLEALEALAAEDFDVVVLDLMMPVLDGTETLSLIRSDPNHGDMEVVVATQLASEEKVRDIITLGVADYILKPLRYESVVDRLRAVVARARDRKKARLRKSELPVILVADPDPNFCDFAISALSGRFHGIAARTAAEALVGVLKNEPRLILLAPNLPGLRFEMLGKKILALAETRNGSVGLISDSRSDNVDKEFVGQVVRTFVPENFVNEVSRLVAGSAVSGSSEPWLKALEPEASSAVRQAMGMMTGFEPSLLGEPTGADPDLFVMIDLRAESGEFDLVVELRCSQSFGIALCTSMLGVEASEVDDEMLLSGVGEILNVVGGRIKNSCANRRIDVLLGLPLRMESPAETPNAFYEWGQHFLWHEEHCFRLGLCGMPGTADGGEHGKSDAGIAASSQSKADAVAAAAAASIAAAAPSGAAGGSGDGVAAEAAAPDASPVATSDGASDAASDAGPDAAPDSGPDSGADAEQAADSAAGADAAAGSEVVDSAADSSAAGGSGEDSSKADDTAAESVEDEETAEQRS
jgi:CheY-like chemotaxis protein